ncbi:MAG: group III truncated hemoglobin [Bacteroidetes bacterium]|jgi:hemoglobin|nr:group III truncated hemoglobin [Bacteroidota bacterium]
MKRDIETKEDIKKLVDQFYEFVKADRQIGRFFTVVVAVDWKKHLPKMYSFWEQVIFGSGEFRGNPMATHATIHTKSPLSSEDFEQWLFLFKKNADELFEGLNTELVKQRAESIATVMKLKVVYNHQALHKS